MVETPRAPFEPDPGDAQIPGPGGLPPSSEDASRGASWEDEPVDFLGLGDALGGAAPAPEAPADPAPAAQPEEGPLALDLDALAGELEAELDAAGAWTSATGEAAEASAPPGAPEGSSAAAPLPFDPGPPEPTVAAAEDPPALAPEIGEGTAPGTDAQIATPEGDRFPSPEAALESLDDLEEEVASWLMELDDDDLEDLGSGVDLEAEALPGVETPGVEEETESVAAAGPSRALGGWLLRSALVVVGVVGGIVGSHWLGDLRSGDGTGGSERVARRDAPTGGPAVAPAGGTATAPAGTANPEGPGVAGGDPGAGTPATDPSAPPVGPSSAERAGEGAVAGSSSAVPTGSESSGIEAPGGEPAPGLSAATDPTTDPSTTELASTEPTTSEPTTTEPTTSEPTTSGAPGGTAAAIEGAPGAAGGPAPVGVPRPPADPALAGAAHEALLADLLATRIPPDDLAQAERVPWWRRDAAADPLSSTPEPAAGSGAVAGRERRTVEFSPEDLVVVPRAESPLRRAEPSDLAGIWLESAIPFEALDGDDRLLTPNVGFVRARFRSGQVFEGRLYAVGGGQVWLETRSGRMALPAWRIEEVAQITEPTTDGNSKGALAGLPRVRVRAPGGVFYGWLVAQDGDRVTLRIESGGRITLDALSVEPAGDTQVRVVEVLDGEAREAAVERP